MTLHELILKIHNRAMDISKSELREVVFGVIFKACVKQVIGRSNWHLTLKCKT
jgi:hypothetical protein